LHNGWSKDHFQLAPVDVPITAHPDLLVEALLDATDGDAPPSRDDWPVHLDPEEDLGETGSGGILVPQLAEALHDALSGRRVSYAGLPFGWRGVDVDIEGPLDYLGRNGGGGVGAGPGIAVGVALALDGSGRLPVAVLGDGDFLMGSSALWTAAHHRLPLLIVVANNRSYFNDEVHQHTVAAVRGRPLENRVVGQHLRNPDPDIAGLARSFGLKGHGPVHDLGGLKAVLDTAVAEVESGDAVVVDVRVSPRGYPGMPAARRGDT
ncbi:MAG TPA: thiamine pyrophosphate-dependent enzyme, partial [Acidimicrobiales bacterium]|nr:thiamine pyrophosphate-dependent enzyme [Acidimicrobiales bacterium]